MLRFDKTIYLTFLLESTLSVAMRALRVNETKPTFRNAFIFKFFPLDSKKQSK